MGIKKVTCYGGGLIGAGWATTFLLSERLEVKVYDLSEEMLENAKKSILRELNFLVGEGVLSETECEEKINSVCFTTDAKEALYDADFIQESTPERLELKQKIISDIEALCRPDAIIASSTSGLLITDIAAKAKHPERFVGGHPYNPVYLLPLVEMTFGERTDKDKLQDAYDSL